jgi:hypothetical protein
MNQHFRLTKLIIVTAAVVASRVPAHCFAEPILLAQMYHSRTQPESNGRQFNFLFRLATVGKRAEMSRMPTTSADVGQTFPADPATVAMFHDLILGPSPGGEILSDFGIPGMSTPSGIGMGDFFGGPFNMGEFPSVPVPDNRLVMKAFLPATQWLGYRISGVEQTIEGLSAELIPFQPTRTLYWGAQTIRIFGERIPEPTSLLLAALLVVGLTWRQDDFFRSRRGHCHRVCDVMPDNRK